MRYNREDIRDRLLEKCFPQEPSFRSEDKAMLRRSRVLADSHNSAVYPLTPSNEISFRRRSPAPIPSIQSPKQPMRTFTRASSLVTLQGKPVQSSRYSLQPVVFKPVVKLEERVVPRVRSAFNLDSIPIYRQDSMHKMVSPSLQPIHQPEPIRYSSRVYRRVGSPNNQHTFEHPYKIPSKNNSTSANSGTHHSFSQQMELPTQKVRQPRPINILSPLVNKPKMPHKISMKGVTIRRGAHINAQPNSQQRFHLNSTNAFSRIKQETGEKEPSRIIQPQGQILDGLLSKICRPECREDKTAEAYLSQNKKDMQKTHSGFLRTRSNWYNKP